MRLVLIGWLILMTLSGCGYHLVGTGGSLPSHIKSIAIPVFQNTSTEPLLERELTSAVREAFLNDARLKVVPVKRGHLLMQGTLEFYELRPVGFTGRDVAQEYWVLLTVKVKVTDQVKDKPFFVKTIVTKWNYIAPQNVANAEEARQEALRQAYRDFGSRLISEIVDSF